MNDLTISNNSETILSTMESIRDNYFFQIKHFGQFIREHELDVNLESIREYIIDLNHSDYSASTKRVKRQALKSRLKALAIGATIEDATRVDRMLKQLDDDPATKAPKINTSEVGQQKIISRDEYNKLLQGARSEKQKLFIEFLFSTGCRISETIGIKINKIKIDGRYARIVVFGKGSKERSIIIPVSLLDRLQSVFKGREYLFSTSTGHAYNRSYISNQIKKTGRHVLDREISAHTLRHSFATLKIHETNKIKAVSVYLGHSSTSITLNMYVHEELAPEELFAENIA
jgi:integrase/recombinase XerD